MSSSNTPLQPGNRQMLLSHGSLAHVMVKCPVGCWQRTLGSLHNDDDDSNENGKKAIGLNKQNNNFARASPFFVHFSAIVARLQRDTD